MVKFLVLDTETGGTDSLKQSILSLAGYAWEPGKQPELVFDIIVHEPELCIDTIALKINKMDLNKVVLEGLHPIDVVDLMQQKIENHFGPEQRLTLVGHNIAFDVSFIKRLCQLAGKPEAYRKMFVHRIVDTSTIMSFMMMTGLLPNGAPGSDRLFELTGVTIPDSDRHTARGDAYATAIALNRLIARVEQGKGND